MVVVSRIGIIGAGLSGITAAKQLQKYDPVVFEATECLGGVWKHCSFRSTKLQTPCRVYEFSGFPWPERNNTSFPSYQEILEYLHSYAAHFDVLKFVKFNSKVVEIRLLGNQNQNELQGESAYEYGNLLNGQPVWEVAVKNAQSYSIEWYAFEFLVVCTGKYGDIPEMPKFPPNKGLEVFKGKVLHTLDYCKLDQEASVQLFKGKKVVIIGYKKSAIDLAVECAQANQEPEGQPCTMVIRSLHWALPNYSIWGLPFYMFYSTRASQFFLERPNQGIFRKLLCRLLSPFRRAISKFIESYLVWKLPLKKYGLKPEHPFEEDHASCQLAVLPEEFFAEADKGMIKFKRASKWWFWEGGVEFDDHTKLEADVVVLATGFDGKKKLKAFLPYSFHSLIEMDGIMPLYRGTVHPLIPNMAFVGYVESSVNLQTFEIRCKWLSGLLENQFKLPNIQKMLEQIQKETEITKRRTRFYKRGCTNSFSINHHDEICQEMGWNWWRKNSWFAEAFRPYSSQDYQDKN